MAASMGKFCLLNAHKYTHAIGRFKSKQVISSVANQRLYLSGTREYARGVRRQPVKVITADENGDDISKPNVSKTPSFSKTPVQEAFWQNKLTDSDKDDHDVDVHPASAVAFSTNLKYEKAYADDKRLGKVITLLKSRKTRQESGKIILEGRRLIQDALLAGAQADTIFFSRVENLKELPLHKTNATLVKVPFKDITMWSDLVTPHGVLGIFKRPRYEHVAALAESSSLSPNNLPLTLICDNIRDPGNMGTILRSAVAAHCNKILVTKGCVDIWEAKVLRAGAGAHFHAPILNNLSWNDVKNFVNQSETTFYIADNNIQPTSSPIVNEIENCSDVTDLETDSEIAMDNCTKHTTDDVSLDVPIAPSIESKPYYDINWLEPCALVIGGETHGLSSMAMELCNSTYGCKVCIPMSRNIESLNNAMSTSIIIFEAQRQMMIAKANKSIE